MFRGEYVSDRAVRNNNPLNVRRTGDDWIGLTVDQNDPDFCSFTHPKFGFRCASKILLRYQEQYKLRTIRALVSRWAPATENNVDAYVDDVALHVGVNPDQVIDLRSPEMLRSVLIAMAHHEDRSAVWVDADVREGMKGAGVA